MKPEDGRCLYREQFVKKDGTLSKTRRQCPRQAYVDEVGGINMYCDEHRREVNETFLRVMAPEKPRVTYVQGPRTIQ